MAALLEIDTGHAASALVMEGSSELDVTLQPNSVSLCWNIFGRRLIT